jgi:hypothetical protein
MDFVKVEGSLHQEALYYYEHNWKAFRDTALARGYIAGYRLLRTQADSAGDFDLILMTEYADSAQFQLREAHFQEIIQAAPPTRLPQGRKPAEFRRLVLYKEAELLFSGQ